MIGVIVTRQNITNFVNRTKERPRKSYVTCRSSETITLPMYFLEGLLILRHEISNQICFWSEREFPDMTNGELSKLIGKFSASLEKNY